MILKKKKSYTVEEDFRAFFCAINNKLAATYTQVNGAFYY